jgi:thiol-disulfide isomerase/thioredoxin
MQFFNQYSVWIIGALLLVAAVATKGRRRWIMAGIVGVYAVACAALWPQTASLPANGLPVLLEVQSPYCLGCVAQKPAVDKLERELAGKLAVRRVNIQSDEGRQLVEQFGIKFTPTFILFDAAGREQWRGSGGLDAATVRRLADEAR